MIHKISGGILVLATFVAASAAAQEQPRFQSSIDVTAVMDVAVVDGSGRPITGLGVGDFDVWIDGEQRRVVSAGWISSDDSTPFSGPDAVVPEGYSSNELSRGGRIIVFAIDQAGINFGGSTAMMSTLTAFIDRLSPSDRVGVVGFGARGTPLTFPPDLNQAKQLVLKTPGLKQPGPPTLYEVTLNESLSILRGEFGTLEFAVERECADLRPGSFAHSNCRNNVKNDAEQTALEALEQANTTIVGLRDLFTTLSEIDAPKTVVLISQGFVVDEFETFADGMGLLAASARASVYVMHLNEIALGLTIGPRSVSTINDRRIRARPLEALAKAARGAMITINGAGTPAFDQLAAELSGYYMLGLESKPVDRDGQAHSVRIEVPWNGAIVRSRNRLLNATLSIDRRTPLQTVASALRGALPMTELPVRVATFSLQGVETGRVQTLIHADIGRSFTAARRVALGYVILDRNGVEVDARRLDTRLPPVMNGVPSALQFAAGASLVPGEYTLRLVAADGERAGSVEHRFQARLPEAGMVRLSELMVGGPTAVRDFLSPTVGYTVSFGSVHGYLEAYGDQAEAVTVKYEIAVAPGADALIAAEVPGRLFGDDRMIFTHVMPVQQLPPGRYVLRALVSLAARPLETLTRPFEVAAAPAGAAVADAAGADAEVELFLPVDEQIFTRPFVRDEALKPEVLQPFRDRLTAGSRPAFEAALASLAAGDYGAAEERLKGAVEPDIDSTPLLTYLAVVYAAVASDVQAAGAWQTALVDGNDIPQIYAWLSQLFLRSRRLPDARAVLEEAHEKWPSDARFSGPLASVYATFGLGREAVLLLEQYLEGSPDDVEAARLGVEWIYQVHAAGRTVYSRPEDLQLAREWAERYGDGPRQALVRQWLDVLQREAR